MFCGMDERLTGHVEPYGRGGVTCAAGGVSWYYDPGSSQDQLPL